MAQRRMGIIALLLCVCLCLMPCRARAASTVDASEPIAAEKECALTISYRSHGTAVSGVPVKLYQIAEVSADAQYALTPSFAASGLVLNGIQSAGEWNVIRSTLEAYILAGGIEPMLTDVTDGEGQVCFEMLKPGLYLAVAGRVAQAKFSPALVMLPGLSADGLWQYQVVVAAKPEVTPSPDPGPGPAPEPDPEYEIQHKVLKLWKGDSGQSDRPQHIEVEIFRDGISYQTVILSEENNWSYSWKAKEDGADWMVVERNIPSGYTVTVEERTTTFVLTNTWVLPSDESPSDELPLEDLFPDDTPLENLSPDEPPLAVSPETGDTSNILLHMGLMYTSGIVLILLGITGKRNRHEKTK